jgi:hypothetical protein
MSDFIRCQRLGVGGFAAIGLSLILIPLLGGVAILAAAPRGMPAWTGATGCFLISFFFAYPTLRMFQWVETDGHIVRGKRLWTQLMVTHRVEDLAEVRGGLGQYAEKGRDPALGAIRAINYQLHFRDRQFIHLSCREMTDVDAFIEKILVEPETGIPLPVSLGGARLGGYVNYDAAAMGRSYAYYGQGHLTITVYIYTGDAPVPAGIDSPRVRSEFDEAKTVAAGMRGPSDGGPPKIEVTKVTLGDAPGSPPALCGTFEFEVEGELVESRIYLTGWGGHFIKLRCTMPASYRNAWGPGLSRFETALGQMLV